MELYENIAEYYDELYAAGDDVKKFYAEETKSFAAPVKYLSIGCGSGTFEHYLAKGNADVTGLETIPQLIESANRKRRTQLMALRFFQMSSLEMCRFLGKAFYDVISIPNTKDVQVGDLVKAVITGHDEHDMEASLVSKTTGSISFLKK